MLPPVFHVCVLNNRLNYYYDYYFWPGLQTVKLAADGRLLSTDAKPSILPHRDVELA